MRLRLLGGSKREADAEDAALAALSVTGDLRVAGAASFPSGLVTQGNLTLEPGARVNGDVRVGGALTLGAGAHVEGNVVVQGDAIAAVDASVAGRLACRRLLLRAGKAPVRQGSGEAEIVASRPA